MLYLRGLKGFRLNLWIQKLGLSKNRDAPRFSVGLLLDGFGISLAMALLDQIAKCFKRLDLITIIKKSQSLAGRSYTDERMYPNMRNMVLQKLPEVGRIVQELVFDEFQQTAERFRKYAYIES